jgi:UDP-glucose 4-epimerase
MLFLTKTSPRTNVHVVSIFGAGLIGSAIHQSLEKTTCYHSETLPFTWNNLNQQDQDVDAVNEKIATALQHQTGAELHASRVSFVWSAGKGGFQSPQDVMEKELKNFIRVLEIFNGLKKKYPETIFDFHLLSSAGGMHDGQRFVDSILTINPCSPYGSLKQTQEQLLMTARPSINYLIYRPASVYGYVGHDGRLGLIPTLLYNGHYNKVTTIYGNLNTLRDYVPSIDVGKYIADRIRFGLSDVKEPVRLLASGKPTSIFEIKNIVEKITGNRIYLTFRDEMENSSDITFSPALLPGDWQCTDIETGIRDIGNRLFHALV